MDVQRAVLRSKILTMKSKLASVRFWSATSAESSLTLDPSSSAVLPSLEVKATMSKSGDKRKQIASEVCKRIEEVIIRDEESQ